MFTVYIIPIVIAYHKTDFHNRNNKCPNRLVIPNFIFAAF